MLLRHAFALAFFVVFGLRLAAQSAVAPTIASISSSQTLTEGQNLTLTVSVNGTTPFSYQWRKAGTAIAGATNSTFVFSPIRVADAGSYTVVVSNSAGSVTSGPVVLAVNAAVAPTFYYQPGPVSTYVGSGLSFSVGVSGTAPMTFVWKKGTTTVATTTSSDYYKASADATDAGTYTVTVTNFAGSITSNAFTVTVNSVTAPVFSSSPTDTTVASGGTLSLYAYASSPAAVTYQWKKDGVALTGANSSSYYKYGVTSADAGSYTVTATNSAGSTTSSAARVTVQAAVAPTITAISNPVTVAPGDSIYLSVNVTGTDPLTFQWKKDGVAIPGAASAYYSKYNATSADAGAYTVTVTNAQGSATSSAVTVTVSAARAPVITYHPASFAVRPGDYLYSLSVGVSGTGPFTYQWTKNGAVLPNSNSSSYYFSSYASSTDAGTYTVTVTNAQGSATSDPCYVTILPASAPEITSSLPSQTIRQGESLNLYASATAWPAPTYQWRKDGVNIAGATSSSLYKSNMASSDAGNYSFVATNTAGSATSNAAAITVIPVAAPQIISHPASVSLLPGDSFYGLYVEYSGGSSARAQWYRDGVALTGATGSYYYIYNAQPSIAGTYTVVVTNSSGSVTSRDAVVTVDANTTRPVFTYVQGGRAYPGGSSAYLTVTTSGSGENVQWLKDGVVIPNATEKQYSFSNFGLNSAGSYTVQVTNASGTFTSRAIALELLNAGVAPLILRPPVPITVTEGGSTSFSVEAEGELPLTYQWKKDGTNLAGATSSNYYVSNVASGSAGNYTVVVTNRNGSATSAAAALTVRSATAVSAPVITRHPGSQTVTVGSGYLSLSVGVLSSNGVTYQWTKNGTAIAGATSSSLSYYTVTSGLAGRYAVKVTNAAGSATSYDAVITVTSSVTGPTFTDQPASVQVYAGANVTFTAAATGASAVTYQWRKDGSNVAGATNATLTLSSVQSADAGTYTVVATDTNGSTPSASATLSVLSGVAPYVISQTVNVTALAGTATALSVNLGGTPTPSVQWQKNGTDLPGATGLVYSIASVQASDGGTYTFVARNAAGTITGSPVTLTVVFPPPVIVSQPASANVLSGGNVTFTVGVSSGPTPAYQWRKDGVALAGATQGSLTLQGVQASAAGRYSVTVTTSYGSVTSLDALLTVGSPVLVTVPARTTVFVGDPVVIAAGVSAVDPLVFRWMRNGQPVPGATTSVLRWAAAQVTDAGPYVLEVTRPDGTVLYPATGSGALVAQLMVQARQPPVFTVQPQAASVPYGGAVTLTALAQGTGPVAYQWRKDGQPVAGATQASLVLRAVSPADAGLYAVLATDTVGTTSSQSARVTVVGSVFAGTYFGTFANGDSWALRVGPEGSGVFLALLESRGQAIVETNVTVGPGGEFRFGQPRSTAGAGASPFATRFYDGEVEGVIAGGLVSGQMTAGGLALAGRRTEDPTTPMVSGFYQAVPLAADVGEIDVLAAPDGSVLLVSVDANGVRGGRGAVDRTGAIAVTQPQFSFRGTLTPGGHGLQGNLTSGAGGAVQFASLTSTGGERLVNVATRGVAGGGAHLLTAGFVIGGTSAKEVLVRAVGPALTAFNVTGVLANPRLRIYRGSTLVLENDDWALSGSALQIADASSRVGAFALPVTGSDAAVLARLEPGAYTAQVLADGTASGVALVEVYDTAATAAGDGRLVNLSTRGDVGRGGDILIVGFVVTGTAPKKMLIRGIGPGLTAFGVTGALENPRLQLYQGSALLRENDDWSSGSEAAALATTATAVGAFALPPGSRDAALLLYLAPGSYTAQVSGVGGTEGIGLVEVYEVP